MVINHKLCSFKLIINNTLHLLTFHLLYIKNYNITTKHIRYDQAQKHNRPR